MNSQEKGWRRQTILSPKIHTVRESQEVVKASALSIQISKEKKNCYQYQNLGLLDLCQCLLDESEVLVQLLDHALTAAQTGVSCKEAGDVGDCKEQGGDVRNYKTHKQTTETYACIFCHTCSRCSNTSTTMLRSFTMLMPTVEGTRLRVRGHSRVIAV